MFHCCQIRWWLAFQKACMIFFCWNFSPIHWCFWRHFLMLLLTFTRSYPFLKIFCIINCIRLAKSTSSEVFLANLIICPLRIPYVGNSAIFPFRSGNETIWKGKLSLLSYILVIQMFVSILIDKSKKKWPHSYHYFPYSE